MKSYGSASSHAPVIWATQVLENLHKTGMATRSEMTDAAHASMAECVMINKGDFTLEVMKTLQDVLSRNKGHQYKKRFRLRPLSIAENFTAQEGNWGITPCKPHKTYYNLWKSSGIRSAFSVIDRAAMT